MLCTRNLSLRNWFLSRCNLVIPNECLKNIKINLFKLWIFCGFNHYCSPFLITRLHPHKCLYVVMCIQMHGHVKSIAIPGWSKQYTHSENRLCLFNGRCADVCRTNRHWNRINQFNDVIKWTSQKVNDTKHVCCVRTKITTFTNICYVLFIPNNCKRVY